MDSPRDALNGRSCILLSHKGDPSNMRYNNPGCLNAFLASFSRITVLFFWLARPVTFNTVFSTFIFPCLGILFLPITTLTYLFLWSPTGLQGLDWLWLGLAALLDILTIASAGYSNRDRIPGYPNSPTVPPTTP